MGRTRRLLRRRHNARLARRPPVVTTRSLIQAELLLVTGQGPERLHAYPPGLRQVG